MADRAALVTGASGGIGFAVAEALAEQGFSVTMVARRPQKLKEVEQKLADAGYKVSAFAADLAKEEEIKAAFNHHKTTFKRLDVLVNNAGIGIGGSVEESTTKNLDIQLAVNLRAPYILTSLAIPLLKESAAETGKSLIVNLASVAGKSGQGWLAAYSATKAGLIGLTESLQLELGSSGIASTAICPGFVDTAMTEWIKGEIPGSEMIQPADIAAAVLFVLNTSKNCIVPEIVIKRPGAAL